MHHMEREVARVRRKRCRSASHGARSGTYAAKEMQKCISWSSKRRECGESDAEVHHMEHEAARVRRKRCISASHGARSGASVAKEMQKCITWSAKRCECGERDA
ncbi:hypothetical protein FHS15_004067 [Paenibacillus castaneae]|uniref:hypothetical protein n=1 Tax=Paenibacillus castaneae TaxID=474957 RepID=UPI0011AF4621|nr:hypothetical protein [Paenibacillus castaneae]NIK78921.1 hypothetical protein [Paenibacillus castaneae]